MSAKIVAIVGSYHKGGVIDQAVSEILRAAEASGAAVSKIYLTDKQINFCANCRACTQSPGVQRGQCVQHDDMEGILAEIESAQAVVLAAPVNFFNVNAITRRFLERLLCYAYWPWGQMAPAYRIKARKKSAVLVTSSAMPGFLVRVFTGAVGALKNAAKLLGARTQSVLIIGLAAGKQNPKLSPRVLKKAAKIGTRLAKSA